MKGIKRLMPTLREKKRYLAFEVISKSKMESYKGASDVIKANFAQFFGSEGLGKAGLLPIESCWNREKQIGLIRVNNKYLNQLRASLTLIQNVEGKDVIVRSLGVSGILKKAKAYLAR